MVSVGPVVFEKGSVYMVVSSPQRGDYALFFSGFPLGGLHSQGIWPLSLWDFKKKASAISCDTALGHVVNQI